MTPEEFTARTAGIAHASRGVFFSELYLFVSICLEHGVTSVVESGVLHGVSTRVFRAIWPGRVVSIEFRPENLPDDLAGSVLIGDGRELVPEQVRRLTDERIGVFVDGPKGVRGMILREWCLTQPQVRVVAQHDALIGQGEHAHSHSDTSQQISAALNERVAPSARAKYPLGGPGLGVWVNRMTT